MSESLARSLTLVVLGGCLIGCGDDGGIGGGGGGSSSAQTGAQTGSTQTGTTTSVSGSTSTTTSTGVTTGGSAIPECHSDDDCFLSNDCCECAGRPVGQTPPGCAVDCLIDTCNSLGVTGTAQCRAGRCVVRADCDQASVVCSTAPPACQPGSVPIIEAGCFAGGCLPAVECSQVTSCGDCAGLPGLTCVQNSAQLPSHHCVDIKPPCPTADCECLGPSVCVGAFNLCSESVDGIDCACPACAQ